MWDGGEVHSCFACLSCSVGVRGPTASVVSGCTAWRALRHATASNLPDKQFVTTATVRGGIDASSTVLVCCCRWGGSFVPCLGDVMRHFSPSFASASSARELMIPAQTLQTPSQAANFPYSSFPSWRPDSHSPLILEHFRRIVDRRLTHQTSNTIPSEIQTRHQQPDQRVR